MNTKPTVYKKIIAFLSAAILFLLITNYLALRELDNIRRGDLPLVDKKNQKPGLMMANIYFVLLSNISRDNPGNILNQKTKLSNLKKFLVALLTSFNYKWIK